MTNATLFIINNFKTGGSEIYLVNLCNRMVESGRGASILVLGKISLEMSNGLDSRVDLFTLSQYLNPVLRIPLYLCQYLNRASHLLFIPFISNRVKIFFQNVHCFDCESVVAANVIFDKAKLTVGIYGPMELLWDNNLKYAKLKNSLCKNIPFQNVYSDKKSLLNKHIKIFDQSTYIKTYYNVFPFAIDLKEKPENHYNLNSSTIITAARHVYNKGFIPFLIENYSELFDRDNLTLKIIGEGPKTTKWKALSENPRIIFMGLLNINDLQKELKDAALFIGSGSTSLLAAQFGIPTIVASESIEGNYIKGYFNEIKEITYKRSLDDMPLDTKIEKFLKLSDIEKTKISHAAFVAAKKYNPEDHFSNFCHYLENSNEVIMSGVEVKLSTFIEIFVKDLFGIDKAYRYRHNHGD